MKASGLLLVVHLCLSSSERWTRYPGIYSKFEYKHWHHDVDSNWGPNYIPYNREKLNGGEFSPFFLPPNVKPKLYNILNAQVAAKKLHNLNAQAKQTEDIVNLFSQPVDKNYAGNEVLRNNGVQNNLSFNSRRDFGDGVEVEQDANQANNYAYIINTTDSNPLSKTAFTTTLTAKLPNQADVIENNPGNRYWVNENNHDYKESYWIHPRPSWNQQPIPIPLNPLDVNLGQKEFYPHNIDLSELDLNQNECYNLADIIGDLRILLHTRNISEEKHALRKLFQVVRVFISNNNLQRASFNVVVGEIESILLNRNDHRNSLREDEIVQILQEFKNQELNDFLLEIRSHRVTSLQVVVSKLALLLSRLKQVLIKRRYSRENIRLVINRAVQWTVPLVGYYFEKECKIKTQQYIVQNLEVALNLKLESVQHARSVDELQTESNFGTGTLGNRAEFDSIARLEDLENPRDTRNVGGLGSLLNLGGSGDVRNGGGSATPGWLGNLGGVEDLGHLGGLESSVWLANLRNLGGVESLGRQAKAVGLEGVGKVLTPINQEA